MPVVGKETYQELADVYAFLGNSLLKPMSQTASVGLDPDFWSAFPHFNSQEVKDAIDGCKAYAEACASKDEEQTITDVSVEYTRLFVGPPSPAAPPWETYYPEFDDVEVTCGFGEPTFVMKKLLRDVGLEISGENHQYEDHMGIELLYASVLLSRAAEGEKELIDKFSSFIVEHPGKWIDRLIDKVEQAFPDGYVIRILRLSKALMTLEL